MGARQKRWQVKQHRDALISLFIGRRSARCPVDEMHAGPVNEITEITAALRQSDQISDFADETFCTPCYRTDTAPHGCF